MNHGITFFFRHFAKSIHMMNMRTIYTTCSKSRLK